MEPRLILLVEEDCLLPVAFDADGRFHEYTKDDESRLWLYFYSSGHSVEYAAKFRISAERREMGYYGNFFTAVEKGLTAGINGNDFPCFELLRQSDMLDEIRKFYTSSTGDRTAMIPVAYVFSESISDKAKKSFLRDMERNGFRVKSFSVSMSELLVRYAVSNSMRDFDFGDHLLVIVSAGTSLRLTTAVYDGEVFLMDGSCKTIDGVGEAPLKYALVKHVVDEVDKNKGYLVTAEKKETEYAWQFTNVDKWLKIKTDSTGDFDIDDFSYSFEPDLKFSCHVVGKFLNSVKENAVRATVSAINSYKENIIGDNLALTVFAGPAFDDDDFISMLRPALDNPESISLPSFKMPSALKTFYPDSFSLEESLADFDSVRKSSEAKDAAIGKWIASAAKIRKLWKDYQRFLPDLKKNVENDGHLASEMIAMCMARLAHSEFDAAREKLRIYDIPGEDTKASRIIVNELEREKDSMSGIFSSVRKISGARLVIDKIEVLSEEALSEISKIKSLQDKISEMKNQIGRYEAKYDDYLSLKRLFNRAVTIVEKRELVEQMRDLTMEELPDLRLNPVRVQLEGEFIVRKAGLFKKLCELRCRAEVQNGESLPCDTLLNISNVAQIEANTGDGSCVAVEFKKGEKKTEYVLPLPDARIKADKPIYLYLFPASDVLDKAAVDAPYFIITPK